MNTIALYISTFIGLRRFFHDTIGSVAYIFPLLVLLQTSGGDGHRGIGKELVGGAEEERSLPAALRMAQEAVHRRCPRPGWHLLHAHAGRGPGARVWLGRLVGLVEGISLVDQMNKIKKQKIE